MPQDEWILGLGGSDHDFSAALAHGTDLRVAVESERITRVKYGIPRWFEDPVAPAVGYCLASEGIDTSAVARTVTSDFMPYRTLARWSAQGHGHHRCHAASVAMLLPPGTRACILVFDGAGSLRPDGANRAEYETFSFFALAEGELESLGGTSGVRFVETLQVLDGGTNSLGQLYELVTTMIGFDRKEAGKTMGLAGWGRPRFLDDFAAFVRFGDTVDDVFAFDPFDPELGALIERRLRDAQDTFAVRADLAATVQHITTACLLHCYGLVAGRDFDVFGVAGGCALNTVANGALAKRLADGRSLVVPAHAGDAGIALGSLWLDAGERAAEPLEMTFRGHSLPDTIARPGRRYSAREARSAARRDAQRMAEDAAVRTPEALAGILAGGAAVGVFNGPSEIGPRALGGRSILADPRTAAVRERINREIKHREPFRPLAPIVLEEHFDRYFTPPAAANRFMLVVAEARDACREEAPAVVHVDGTARVQTVPADGDPFLVRLLNAFQGLTGLPMLLNTSFNRPGEPIVETPEDAVDAFVSLGLDGLWLEGTFLRRVG